MNPILNVADAAAADITSEHGDFFACRATPLAEKLGATRIGVNLTTVPPGKAAYPYHHHHANEEHFYVVRGTGRLRFGDAVHPLKPGDYVFCPPGGPEVAHQFLNDGTEDLVFLAFSTKQTPEVVGYPDSGKIGVRPVSYFLEGPHRFLVREDQRDYDGYWNGEDASRFRHLLNR
ncbi:MAG TPA: cupin domain-containing protein [Nevskiaceae bacterium]|nr:cupin domain-containing protein [Nevskiaceae bacterium]